MTKAARIMALAAQGLTTRQIACEVNGISDKCPARLLDSAMAYVRVVLRQRKGTGRSKHDISYQSTEAYRQYQRDYHRNRYHTDPEFRERLRQQARDWQRTRYHTDPEFRAKKIARKRQYLAKTQASVAESVSA